MPFWKWKRRHHDGAAFPVPMLSRPPYQTGISFVPSPCYKGCISAGCSPAV